MAKRKYYRAGWIQWLDKGRRHREDGPAVVWHDGSQWWCRHGRSHFAHGPADLNANGWRRWYEDNKFLRERGPYG